MCESLVSRLPSQHLSPDSHCCHLRVGPEGPATNKATGPFHALTTSSLTFRRATNPRTGNDWQPFRNWHGLVSSMQGTIARRKAISYPKAPFCDRSDKPAVRTFDDTIYARRGLIHDLNIEPRSEDRFNGTKRR